MATKEKELKKKEEFKLPKYLKLEKGSMWFDIDGEYSSGVKLYSTNKVLVGRSPNQIDIEKDDFDNKNLVDFGKKTMDLPWYFDTTKIPTEKLSRILLAYKHGLLTEADPNNPPKPLEIKDTNDFKFKENGDRIFTGKNKEMYLKLQNNNFKTLRDFINSTPKTESGKQNLMDLFDYEKKGFNPLNRPRFEVLELIRVKLREFGPGISGIRINEED